MDGAHHYSKEVVVVTVTTTAAAPTVTVDTTISDKPTRAKVLDAIQREAGCPRDRAGSMLDWLAGIVDKCRSAKYSPYYPSAREMNRSNYGIMDVIIGHGVAAKPGSAHALVQDLLLDPTKDETAIFHDNRDEEGSPTYCQIQVAIGVF